MGCHYLPKNTATCLAASLAYLCSSSYSSSFLPPSLLTDYITTVFNTCMGLKKAEIYLLLSFYPFPVVFQLCLSHGGGGGTMLGNNSLHQNGCLHCHKFTQHIHILLQHTTTTTSSLSPTPLWIQSSPLFASPPLTTILYLPVKLFVLISLIHLQPLSMTTLTKFTTINCLRT